MEDVILTGTNNWTAIGTSSLPFTGSFDGDGHTITGLDINANTGNQGMFGYIGMGGVIENFGLVDANVFSTNGTDIGIAAGTNSGGIIRKVFTTGRIESTYDVTQMRAGGIVGRNLDPGMIEYCYSTAEVITIGSRAGGIVGSGSNISNCVALNSLVQQGANLNVGRIAGYSSAGTSNNFAYYDMVVMHIPSGSTLVRKTIAGTIDNEDGEDITAANVATVQAMLDAAFGANAPDLTAYLP